MTYPLGSGCAIFKKRLGEHATMYSGPVNIGDGLMVQMIADHAKGEYFGSILDPKDKWKECHSFRLGKFGDRNKQRIKIKGLGDVIFNRGKTAAQESCIRLQVLSLQKELPM